MQEEVVLKLVSDDLGPRRLLVPGSVTYSALEDEIRKAYAYQLEAGENLQLSYELEGVVYPVQHDGDVRVIVRDVPPCILQVSCLDSRPTASQRRGQGEGERSQKRKREVEHEDTVKASKVKREQGVNSYSTSTTNSRSNTTNSTSTATSQVITVEYRHDSKWEPLPTDVTFKWSQKSERLQVGRVRPSDDKYSTLAVFMQACFPEVDKLRLGDAVFERCSYGAGTKWFCEEEGAAVARPSNPARSSVVKVESSSMAMRSGKAKKKNSGGDGVIDLTVVTPAALVEACNTGNEEPVASFLKSNPASALLVVKEKFIKDSLLHIAAKRGCLNIVKCLVEAEPQIMKLTNDTNCTPLHIAARLGRTHICEYIIGRSKEVFKGAIAGMELDSKYNYTPLVEAVYHGQPTTALALIKHGADVEHREENGHTPLIMAVLNKHFGCVKALIEGKANVNSTAPNGNTPLIFATKDGFYEAAQALVNSGANTELCTKSNRSTPLSYAVFKGDLKIVTLLCEAGANVDAQNKSGETALHVAVRKEYSNIVRVLLQFNANKDIAAANGSTPLSICNDEELQALLQAHVHTERGSGTAAQDRVTADVDDDSFSIIEGGGISSGKGAPTVISLTDDEQEETVTGHGNRTTSIGAPQPLSGPSAA